MAQETAANAPDIEAQSDVAAPDHATRAMPMPAVAAAPAPRPQPVFRPQPSAAAAAPESAQLAFPPHAVAETQPLPAVVAPALPSPPPAVVLPEPSVPPQAAPSDDEAPRG